MGRRAALKTPRSQPGGRNGGRRSGSAIDCLQPRGDGIDAATGQRAHQAPRQVVRPPPGPRPGRRRARVRTFREPAARRPAPPGPAHQVLLHGGRGARAAVPAGAASDLPRRANHHAVHAAHGRDLQGLRGPGRSDPVPAHGLQGHRGVPDDRPGVAVRHDALAAHAQVRPGRRLRQLLQLDHVHRVRHRGADASRIRSAGTGQAFPADESGSLCGRPAHGRVLPRPAARDRRRHRGQVDRAAARSRARGVGDGVPAGLRSRARRQARRHPVAGTQRGMALHPVVGGEFRDGGGGAPPEARRARAPDGGQRRSVDRGENRVQPGRAAGHRDQYRRKDQPQAERGPAASRRTS